MDTGPTVNYRTTILLVDDEQNILSALKRELYGWDTSLGLKVITASSAKLALGLLEKAEGSIGVVVSDLKMPEMLGSDFLLEVRRLYPDIVTLLLTGFSETAQVMKAVQAGIFSYLIKPWEPDYLKAELVKALETRRIKLENQANSKRMEEELRWAGEMQRALLKPDLRSTRGVEFRVSYRPLAGLHCGGDYYDVINLPGGRYMVLLGDVAGHGIKGAFITVMLKAMIYPEYLRNRDSPAVSPAAFLSWLNGRLYYELRQTSGIFVTMFAAILDPDAKTLTYANAGHLPPVLQRAWQSRLLDQGGSPLGFAAEQKFEEAVIPLEQGDLLLLYTDGLVELGSTESGSTINILDLLVGEWVGTDFHRRLMAAALGAAGRQGFDDDLTLLTAQIL